MTWWAWVLIWAGLVLALLVMLALFAWWLFRKAMRLFDDAADLADTAGVLEIDDVELPRQQIAVLSSMRDIRHREDARRAHRAERRRLRRERRMTRARHITMVDASTVEWPSDWTR